MKKLKQFIIEKLFPVKEQEKVEEVPPYVSPFLTDEDRERIESWRKHDEIVSMVRKKYRQPKLPTIPPDYSV